MRRAFRRVSIQRVGPPSAATTPSRTSALGVPGLRKALGLHRRAPREQIHLRKDRFVGRRRTAGRRSGRLSGDHQCAVERFNSSGYTQSNSPFHSVAEPSVVSRVTSCARPLPGCTNRDRGGKRRMPVGRELGIALHFRRGGELLPFGGVGMQRNRSPSRLISISWPVEDHWKLCSETRRFCQSVPSGLGGFTAFSSSGPSATSCFLFFEGTSYCKIALSSIQANRFPSGAQVIGGMRTGAGKF